MQEKAAHSHKVKCIIIPYFFNQTPTVDTIFFAGPFSAATIRGWLLFEGRDYIIGKPADSNNSWIRYMQVIQLAQTDAGSSTCSLSVLLSAVETIVLEHKKSQR